MIKVYRKTATIKAEQFNPENCVIPEGVFDKEYEHTTSVMMSAMVDELENGNPSHNWHVKTIEGDLKVKPGDWIATGSNGEHWPIADNIFKNTYAELPVIPKAVADWIDKCKQDGTSISFAMDKEKFPEKVADYFRTYYTRDQWIEIQDTFARVWLDGYTVEGRK
jgi:hypothetical protein